MLNVFAVEVGALSSPDLHMLSSLPQCTI